MSGRGGIAQLLVLWALALLGTLALGFSYSMRTEALAARNGIDEARAYFQARTGIDCAIALLASTPADNVLRMRIAREEEDTSFEVRVESESGKVDINLVSGEALLGILRKGGLTDEAAESVRDAILDWRDEDDDARPRGAERREYAQLREPIVPRNGRLPDVEELRFVMGVTPEFHREFLSKVFTAHGSSPQVDYRRAPGIVLRSLPGVSSGAADRIVAGRGEDPPLSPADLSAMVGEGLLTAQGLAMISGGAFSNAYTITATGKAGGGVSRTVRCLVEISEGGRKGVKILRWQDHARREVDG